MIRDKTDDGGFKNNLNQLIHTVEAYGQSRMARQPTTQPAPHADVLRRPEPRSVAVQRPAYHRPSLHNPQRFYQQAPTQWVNHHDVYTARTDPGRRPGVGNEPGNIWSGFKQGSNKGNCTTAASIKIAMMRFGQKPTDIFKQVIASADGWNIQMRDDRWYHLSKSELTQATRRSEFSGDSPSMVADANFLYAVSAKRAQMENKLPAVTSSAEAKNRAP